MVIDTSAIIALLLGEKEAIAIAAGLNIGDCCAYALSKISDEPLLFKGEDSSKSDILRVSY